MSIKLSSTYSLITRTIKINGGPYAVKKSTRNIWKKIHLERFSSESDLHCTFFFHLLFMESFKRGKGGEKFINS